MALEKMGVNPERMMVDLLNERIIIDPEDLEKPEIRFMLSDYEVYPENGKVILRPRWKGRLEILKTFLEYKYPKMKTSETTGHVDNTLTVKIVRSVGNGEQDQVINITPVEKAIKAAITDAKAQKA